MPGPVRFVGLAVLALLGCAREAAPVSSLPEGAEPAAEPAAAPVEPAPPAPSEPVVEAPPAASASASASASIPVGVPGGVPVAVEIGEPKFSAGEVPKAKAALDKLAPKLKACIDDAGGLAGTEGSVEVQLLVRAAGKAEGVDVVKAKGISDEAKKCIVTTLQKKTVGTPSADPVGVTFVLKLTPAK
jgi:hypothetical protein